jgi:hypothetical protein
MKKWVKNILAGLRSDYPPESHKVNLAGQSKRFPVHVLSERIGEPLEVHYLDQGSPQVMEAELASRPNDHFFYLTLDKTDMSIVYWYTPHADGRLSGVKLIKKGDSVLYENNQIEFDYERAEFFSNEHPVNKPMRMITREYLTGMFG